MPWVNQPASSRPLPEDVAVVRARIARAKAQRAMAERCLTDTEQQTKGDNTDA